MARELESFRLPNEWGSETDDDQNSPRLYLKNSINLDLPISGGWGYSEEDCVVIDMNDPTVDQDKTFEKDHENGTNTLISAMPSVASIPPIISIDLGARPCVERALQSVLFQAPWGGHEGSKPSSCASGHGTFICIH